MEFFFELLFELFGEILLQVVLEALAEASLRLVGKRRRVGPTSFGPALRFIGYAIFGLLAGGVSLLILPNSLMHTQAGRVASLLLSPVAAGLSMGIVGAWRQKRGQQVIGLDRFAPGYVFALALAVVRFNWAN